jgi:hypothetical protein
MLPSENMDTTLGKKGHIYLADVHTFGGNGGSPVIVNVGGFRDGLMSGDQFVPTPEYTSRTYSSVFRSSF